jgi:hypothetical protein
VVVVVGHLAPVRARAAHSAVYARLRTFASRIMLRQLSCTQILLAAASATSSRVCCCSRWQASGQARKGGRTHIRSMTRTVSALMSFLAAQAQTPQTMRLFAPALKTRRCSSVSFISASFRFQIGRSATLDFKGELSSSSSGAPLPRRPSLPMAAAVSRPAE